MRNYLLAAVAAAALATPAMARDKSVYVGVDAGVMLVEDTNLDFNYDYDLDTTYDGKYYQLQRANCDPKPLQQPHPPIWIGGGGEQLTLRVVARHADCSNFGGKPHEFAHKCEILKDHCKAVGRDYDEIRKTWSPQLFIREDEAELASGKNTWNEPFESWREGNLVGTPEQVAAKLQTYIELGCTGFVPWCCDYPETESLELFATKVMPSFR